MKNILWIALILVAISGFFAAGFATGVPYGRSIGFSLGSEWVMMQAEMLAREKGVFMPIRYEEGQFRIRLKQPPNLYRRAWKLADRYEEEMAYADKISDYPGARGPLARNIRLSEKQGTGATVTVQESVRSLFQASHGVSLGTGAVEGNSVCSIKDIAL